MNASEFGILSAFAATILLTLPVVLMLVSTAFSFTHPKNQNTGDMIEFTGFFLTIFANLFGGALLLIGLYTAITDTYLIYGQTGRLPFLPLSFAGVLLGIGNIGFCGHLYAKLSRYPEKNRFDY